jgi:hypothetical protein
MKAGKYTDLIDPGSEFLNNQEIPGCLTLTITHDVIAYLNSKRRFRCIRRCLWCRDGLSVSLAQNLRQKVRAVIDVPSPGGPADDIGTAWRFLALWMEETDSRYGG